MKKPAKTASGRLRKKPGRAAAGWFPALPPTPPEEAAIRALRAASNQAIADGNIGALSGSLAEDFVVIIGDGTLLSRDAYIAAFASTFQQPEPLRYERVPDAIRLSTSLLLAAEQGRWTGRLPNGNVLFTGTYAAMWRRSSAGWQLRSELFVTLT